MMRNLSLSTISLSILVVGCGSPRTDSSRPEPGDAASAGGVPLIQRKVLFGNPDRAAPRLSPDGTRLAYLAPVGGVMNVWVGPLNNLGAARPVTHDTKRTLRSFQWAYTNQHILYPQDVGGNEDWHIYCVDLASGKTRDLTPLPNVAARIEDVSRKTPDEVLIGLNDVRPQYHNLYRINLTTAERRLVYDNKEFAGFVTDEDYRVRFATRMTPDGGQEILRAAASATSPAPHSPPAATAAAVAWERFVKVKGDDALTTAALALDASGKLLYMFDSRGRDTAALTVHHVDSGDETMLAVDGGADAGGVLVHPTTLRAQAAAFTRERRHWRVIDPAVKDDLAALEHAADGDFDVLSRSQDDRTWLVQYTMDNGPVRFYRYDRPTHAATFLFTNRRAIEGLPLTRMHPVTIHARDGLPLVSYLSLPRSADPKQTGRPDSPGPMVLFVHGGPWGRDQWGYNAVHQWLSNRGYAVLSVNFRGSTGFGKQLVNAGNLEWAGKMHTDLIDAVNWAVKEGVADPKRIAIMGGSYGGYATLVGLTWTPDVFACGVDIVGPSNLVTLLNSIPPYWAPMLELFASRVGDPRTEPGRALLTERSPLTRVDRIRKPLLIGQGKNDPRVKQAEADQIVKAMQEKRIPVTYALFPDEGHGFARPENNLAFYAVTEAFLAAHLGGRSQPIGDDFQGSSVTVPTGADQIAGLPAAIKKKR